MIQEALTRLLRGRVIKEVRGQHEDLGNFHGIRTIEEIEFEDGSALELSGNADEAYFWCLRESDGRETREPGKPPSRPAAPPET